MFFPILIASVTLVVLIQVFFTWKIKKLECKIPGPAVWPIVGNAHRFLGDGVESLNLLVAWSRKYGPRLRAFIGYKLYVVLNSAKDIEVVISSSVHIDKASEYRYLHPWLGTGLVTSGGSKWRKRRKMITPAFHFKILENFIPAFNKNSDILIKKLESYVGKEKFDVCLPVTLCTLDVISESAMGVSVNAQNDEVSEYAKAIKNVCCVAMMRMKSILCRFDFLFQFTPYYRVHKKALHILHSYTDKMIKERRKMLENGEIDLQNDSDASDIGAKKKLAFLDLLILSKIDGESLDDASIREEVDTFLFEGHDTTTSAVSFALHSIAANEHVQNQLYEEQVKIFGSDLTRPINYADLQEMKYMEAVIKETLRLYPSVPVIARKLQVDCLINDIKLAADTSVLLNLFVLHRDPEVFPDPEKFVPERFMQEDTTKRNPYACISFSAGPRNCIGQKFAMLEMKLMLSKILQNYKLIGVDDKLQLSANVILMSANGIHIKISKR